MDSVNEISINEKIALTVEEAAAYSNIGVNSLRHLIKQEEFKPIILKVGNKTLIKRTLFEQFIIKAKKI